MLALRAPPRPPPPISTFESKLLRPILPFKNPNFHSCFISRRKKYQIYAENGNGDKKKEAAKDNGGEGEEKVKNGEPRLNLKWAELVLDPDPDNLVAVGLTGLLTWASVQVLWQLFVISAAIVLAALKYSVVAALLVFILITLL